MSDCQICGRTEGIREGQCGRNFYSVGTPWRFKADADCEANRLILPGSCWRRKADGEWLLCVLAGRLVLVDVVRPRIGWRSELGIAGMLPQDCFRAAFSWVADPGVKT